MPDQVSNEFPLFPLGLVALPNERVPLHIFEERYKTMMNECLREDREFGIVWLSDDGLREVGCACLIERVLERMEDGRMNLLTRGTRPFRMLERQSHLPVELLEPEKLSGKCQILPRRQVGIKKRGVRKEPDGRLGDCRDFVDFPSGK